MNKLYLLLCFFCLPLAVSAQTSFTIVENGEEQIVEGELKSADGIEYISTPLKHYQIINKNMALLGDLVEDNVIDIYDVTKAIDLVLVGSYALLGDIDENEDVDIFDVTAMIDIALGLNEAKSVFKNYEVIDVTDVWIKGRQDDAPVDQN